MEPPEDALERLLDSPLVGRVDGPVHRGTNPLRGITKRLALKYGGGHLVKRGVLSNVELGARVHGELHRWVSGVREPRHRWTDQAIYLLEANGLRAVAAEVPVAHGELGTRVDLVARRAIIGGYALVSLKTGFRRGPDARNRRALPAPFSVFKRCERTLDDLQIAAERGLARKGHDVLFDVAYVLEVPEGVLRKAPAWTTDVAKQDALLADLLSND
jgi:hypothetical protein